HQRIQRTGFPDRRGQPGWADAQPTRFEAERFAVGTELPEYDIVSVHISANAQHGGVAKLRIGRKSVAVKLGSSSGMGVDFLPPGSKTQNRQLFEPLTEPVEPRPSAFVFKGKHQKDSLRSRDVCRTSWRNLRVCGEDGANRCEGRDAERHQEGT